MAAVTRKILLLDDDGYCHRSYERAIKTGGDYDCSFAANIDEAYEQVGRADYDLLLVDIHLKRKRGGEDDGIEFVDTARRKGFSKLVMIISADKSCDHFIRAAQAGANDYWVKLSELSIQDAVNLIVKRFDGGPRGELRPTRVDEVCFFRCVGFKKTDCLYMQKYYDMNFPSFDALAKAMGASHDAVKNRFLRIRNRLGIRNNQQLAAVLTACSFYRL
jgi:DNA-binding NarL/FixJ family response regulator